ncbi:MAG: ABC transporter permease [Bacteroidota bacterium]|nr:MAG: ABC transporter permease [Bacteroidota bacterium]
MNLSFFIARRYILGKKSHNAINIVSGLSTLGVVVGTMAFILILSVFNGFDKLVQSMYNSFYPDIAITPAQGKIFVLSTDTLALISKVEGVEEFAEILEDNGLLVYNEKQTVSTIRGVSSNYQRVNSVDSLLWRGDFSLYYNNIPMAVMGRGLAYHLNLNPDMYEPLKVFVPKRSASLSMDPNKSLTRKLILVSGIFSSQPDIDGKYTLVPISFARELFDYPIGLTSLEIKLNSKVPPSATQKNLQKLLGEKFMVKNKYEQNELLYKTMRTEKWAIFAILALVLIILLFSLVGSLSMLIIEKKNDIKILHSLGASQKLIRKIFYREGLIITMLGVLIGLAMGILLVWIQEKYEIVKLHGGFIIDAYPVELQRGDVLIVVGTVVAIGTIAAWYPVRFLLKNTVNAV